MARPLRRAPYGGAQFGGSFSFSLTPWVKRLLIANAAVFLLMLLGLQPRAWWWRTFGFAPAELLTHPWSPLTYMFVHGDFWHLFFNMVGVFFFGPPLERAWGSAYFIRFYLVAGLGGALFSVAMLPAAGSAPVVGASGALYGLLLAFALRWPDALIYIWGILPIKAKWFVAIFGFFALWGTLTAGPGGGVAHWAHLGGLVTGFVYLRFGDRIEWRSRSAWRRARRGLERAFLKEDGEDAELEVKREPGRRREIRPRRRRGVDGDTLDRVDEILDKIRERGMDSLTEEERRFLDEVSRRYQETP